MILHYRPNPLPFLPPILTGVTMGNSTLPAIFELFPPPPPAEGYYPKLGILNITNVTLWWYTKEEETWNEDDSFDNNDNNHDHHDHHHHNGWKKHICAVVEPWSTSLPHMNWNPCKHIAETITSKNVPPHPNVNANTNANVNGKKAGADKPRSHALQQVSEWEIPNSFFHHLLQETIGETWISK